MDKRCRQNSIKIYEYLDKKEQLAKRGLSYVDADLERHMESCPACRQEYKASRQVFDTLADMPDLEPPNDFTAQLMMRLPQVPKAAIPQWLIMIGGIVLLLPSVFIFGLFYNSVRFGNKLNFLKTVFSSLLGKLLDFLEYVYQSTVNVIGVAAGITKALWALVMTYPLYFLSMLAVLVLVFTVMARLIRDFQRENYA